MEMVEKKYIVTAKFYPVGSNKAEKAYDTIMSSSSPRTRKKVRHSNKGTVVTFWRLVK